MSKKSERVPIKGGVWNVGDRPWREVAAGVVDFAFGEHGLDWLVLNEVGDKERAISSAAQDAIDFYIGGRSRIPHSRKEAVLWSTEKMSWIDPERSWLEKLDDAFDAHPKSAGGSDKPPKYLHAVELLHLASGRTPIIGGVHLVPSQQYRVNADHAKKSVVNLAGWVREQSGLVFVAGDMNARPDSVVMNPLAAHMTSNHHALGEKPTFGRRAIDHVWARGDYVFTRHEVIDMGRVGRGKKRADHGLLIVEGTVSPKVQRPEQPGRWR